jgi:hypothetical protein
MQKQDDDLKPRNWRVTPIDVRRLGTISHWLTTETHNRLRRHTGQELRSTYSIDRQVLFSSSSHQFRIISLYNVSFYGQNQ